MARRHAKPVYRRPLQEVWAEHGGEAPGVFAESLAALRQRGLQMGGLFQGRTDERKVRLLERAWDLGQSPLRAARVQDCHAVADSLLLWLRLLPAPVVPCRLFRQCLRAHAAGSGPECLAQLHYLLDQLEPCELGVLQPLLAFLHEHRAAQRRAGGRGPDNGRVFGPALLRPFEGPLPMAFPEDTAAAAALVDCLVADYPAVFEHPHAAAGAHKPPCRAKRARKPEAWQPEPAQPAAGCAEAGWPGRHLRVVVVPPFTDAEVCYVEQEDGVLLQHSSAPACHPAAGPSGRLASVPEACPLGACCQDTELDALVGSLLSGSAQSTLFEADDGAFLARTASLLACPRACDEASVSSDASADCGSLPGELLGADSPLASPQRPPHRRAWCAGDPQLGRWLEISQ